MNSKNPERSTSWSESLDIDESIRFDVFSQCYQAENFEKLNFKYNPLESFKERAEVDNEMLFRKGLLIFLFHKYVRMSMERAF